MSHLLHLVDQLEELFRTSRNRPFVPKSQAWHPVAINALVDLLQEKIEKIMVEVTVSI